MVGHQLGKRSHMVQRQNCSDVADIFFLGGSFEGELSSLGGLL